MASINDTWRSVPTHILHTFPRFERRNFVSTFSSLWSRTIMNLITVLHMHIYHHCAEVAGGFTCPAAGEVSGASGSFSRHAHPDDCRKYYICLEGIAREYGCPIGTVFKIGDADGSGACEDPEDVPGWWVEPLSLFFIENFLNCGVFFYICNISNSKIRNYFLVKKKYAKRSHFEERVEFE